MCLDFYTLDVRNLGQVEGAHKVGASMGSLKMLAFLGRAKRLDPYCEYWVYVLCAVMGSFHNLSNYLLKNIKR